MAESNRSGRVRRLALLLVLVQGAGCPGTYPRVPPPEAVPVVLPPPPEPAGFLEEGLWRDARYPVSLQVLEGWVATSGTAEEALRVSLRHVATAARLEVWVFAGPPGSPRPRAGCSWSFQDAGAFELLRVPGAERVATCLPEDPAEPVVLAAQATLEGVTCSFELVVPEGRMQETLAAGEAVLATVRLK